ncbi:MAG: hypothetical protein U1G07_27330, partial [Verrucomicrobiota bacterium]
MMASPSILSAAPIQAEYHINPGGVTLQQVRDTIRANKGSMTGDIIVHLHGGSSTPYPLSQTVVFDQNDSGNNGFSIIYQAADGEGPVLSGGVAVTGPWTSVGNGVWKSPVPGTVLFRQLYVNGSCAIRAREPDSGNYYRLINPWDRTGFYLLVHAYEVANWSRFDQVEMVMLRSYRCARLHLASFTVAGNVAKV